MLRGRHVVVQRRPRRGRADSAASVLAQRCSAAGGTAVKASRALQGVALEKRKNNSKETRPIERHKTQYDYIENKHNESGATKQTRKKKRKALEQDAPSLERR